MAHHTCPVCTAELEIDTAQGQAYITEEYNGAQRVICADHPPQMAPKSVDRSTQAGDGTPLLGA